MLQHDLSGSLEVAAVPPPICRPEGAVVRTAFSLISSGTERATRELAKKTIVGKALARPREARCVPSAWLQLGQTLRRHFAQRHEPLMIAATLNAGYLAADHWANDPLEGGRILGEACHFVDLMRYIVGAPPTSVVAERPSDVDNNSGANVVAVIRFADGSVGSLVYQAKGADGLAKERIEAHAGRRSAMIDDFTATHLYDGAARRTFRMKGQHKGHLAEMRAFLAFVAEGGDPPLELAESVSSTPATIAIHRSLDLGRSAPVEQSNWPSDAT